jgi:hypothetical protein
MILGEDYMFIDKIKADTTPLKLLTGPYKDVVYRYINMSVKENTDDTATLVFDYELFEMGNHTETTLRKDDRFTEHIGLVLNALILEAVEYTEKTQTSKVT